MPLKNFKGVIEYDGTGFEGFQVQPEGHRTVQGEINETLGKILDHPVKIKGASRTDAGVHAAGQVIAFRTSASRTLSEIICGANSISPGDWRIIDLAEVAWEFHPRYDAVAKTYFYIIDRSDSVLRRRFSWGIVDSLDMEKMHLAASLFIGEHDFRSFTTLSAHRGEITTRRMDKISVAQSEDLVKIEITGSGFLYQMVRRMVAAIVATGRGEMKTDEIDGLLIEPRSDGIGSAAPARGLILKKVHY